MTGIDPQQPQEPQPTPFVPPPLPPAPLPPLPSDLAYRPGGPAATPAAAQVPGARRTWWQTRSDRHADDPGRVPSISVERLVQWVVGLAVAAAIGWFGLNQYSDHREAQKVETLTSQVQQSMQEKFDTDSDFSKYNLSVDSVSLIKETDTKYSGMATVHTPTSGEHQVSIEVMADDSQTMWEAKPGAMMFLVQEQLQHVFGTP